MSASQRKRIGALVLVSVGVLLAVAAFLTHADDAQASWSSYSWWSRRWIFHRCFGFGGYSRKDYTSARWEWQARSL
jgi:hypothetical protein